MGSSDSLSPLQLKLLLFGLGGFALIAGLSALKQGWGAFRVTTEEMPNWAPVDAQVVDAYVHRSTRTRGGGGGKSGRSVDVYQAVIEYQYTYEGKSYTSDKYTLMDSSYSEDWASQKALVDQHPEGKQVTAYVNPENPEQAVLNREETEAPIAVAIAGAFFTLVGAGVLVVALVLTLRKSG